MLRIELTANKRRSRETGRMKTIDDEENEQDKIGGGSVSAHLFSSLACCLPEDTTGQLQTTLESEN